MKLKDKKGLANIQKLYPQVFLDDSRKSSTFAESYRTLRTNIHFSMKDRPLHSIAITSSGQSEGKTVTAYNLAYTMALANRNVLIIDADLRRPMLTQVVKSLISEPDEIERGSNGLTGVLSQIIAMNISEGNLSDFNINDLFKILSFQKKNGLLKIYSEKHRFDIRFLNGLPVSINWGTRPEKEHLANILVQRDIITRQKAEDALRQQKETGQRLGFILINSGDVSANQLKGILTIHASQAIHALLQTKEGRFSFDERFRTYLEQPDKEIIDLHHLYQQAIEGNASFQFFNRLIDASIVTGNHHNLSFLPSGIIPPNPSELLESRQMEFLIELFMSRFDMVVIDTPPLLPASDALLIGGHVDGIALVVKSAGLRRNMIQRVVEQIQATNANLLGVILNQVDVKREGYYRYYNKYYSGYYSKNS